MNTSPKIFRAWDTEDQKFIYFGLWDTDQGLHLGSLKQLDEMLIMQFTGLKDKNGKEIYEGDIIRGMLDPEYENFEVIFDKDARFAVKRKASIEDFCLCDVIERKVIGNIYQNSELIKK